MAKEAQLPEKTASHDHGTKRLKHASILEEDRISSLPDSILLTILSSFTTKDAIKTGVLCKRWAYLWTSVPSLSFTDTSYENAAAFATTQGSQTHKFLRRIRLQARAKASRRSLASFRHNCQGRPP